MYANGAVQLIKKQTTTKTGAYGFKSCAWEDMIGQPDIDAVDMNIKIKACLPCTHTKRPAFRVCREFNKATEAGNA